MKNSIRHVIKMITPPIFPAITRWAKKLPVRDRLFGGEDDLFLSLVGKATRYAEYGCGASTIWVARETSLPITSIDTSEAWLQHVRTEIPREDDINLVHVDLGDIGDWGRPVDYFKRDNFINYVEGPWATEQDIDLILIDGRFRMACFLTSLLRAKPGTVILFDDYIGRTHLRVAETFLPFSQRNDRQAAFVIPAELDRALIEAERDRFLYVMD